MDENGKFTQIWMEKIWKKFKEHNEKFCVKLLRNQFYCNETQFPSFG